MTARSEAWTAFAAAAMLKYSREPYYQEAHDAACDADEMLAEYDKRFDENGKERKVEE